MRMKSERSPFKTIMIATISSTLLLVALSYFFYTYFLPYYQISIVDVYGVLVRILPIVIGLLLMIIALVISPPLIPQTSDDDDEIPRDKFTAPLYELPDEEKSISMIEIGEKVESSPIQEKIVSEQLSPVSPVYIHELKEVEKPVETIIEEELDSIEVVEQTPLVETPQLSKLDRAVTFEYYQYPIEQHSEIAQLLAPIEQSTPVDLTEMPELTKQIELSLSSLLEDELESAIQNQYPLSLVNCAFREENEESVDESRLSLLLEKLELLGIVSETDDDTIAVILPFYSYKRTQQAMATVISSIKKSFDNCQLVVGFTTVDQRESTVETLIEESHLAFELALQKEGNALIGYEKEEDLS